jgi:nicotinamidase-related amidase
MKTALLLIDFQRDFGAADGAMARQGHDITAAQAAVVKAQALAQAARAASVPVIFVRLISDQLCIAGTLGAAFIGPQPQAGEYIVTKSRFSAFANTDLADHLRGHGIGTTVLAGLTTECCVASTAWAAFEEGLQVTIAADACAAYEEELHRVTLKTLALSGAVVRDGAGIAAGWK